LPLKSNKKKENIGESRVNGVDPKCHKEERSIDIMQPNEPLTMERFIL
jgi:hypothetical protein